MKSRLLKNLKKCMVLVLGLLILIPTVYADTTCTIAYTGNSTVTLNSTITLNLQVQDVVGATYGVVSLSGNLSYDSDYLEYVSATSSSDSPYSFSINTSNSYKIYGMSFDTTIGIKTNTTVMTITFKALKTGTTQVTFTNAKATDATFKYTATVVPKTITITDGSSNTTKPTTTPSSTKSSDATLSTLGATGYTLSPSFDPNTTDYTITVPDETTSVTLTGDTTSSKASVSGLGDITLTGEETTATVTVKAEDGTEKTYTIKIKKSSGTTPTPITNGDATLKSLDISGYTLNPTFDPETTSYKITVANTVTGLNVDAVPNDSTSTVTITGNKSWIVGTNTVLIKVVATDGTTRNYIINVTREGSTSDSSGKTTTTKAQSSDNTLKDLIINSSHTISPEFSSSVDSYNVVVPYDVTSLDLTPVLNDSKASYRVLNNEDFRVGVANIVMIEVTAEDGSKRLITLNVTRTTDTDETDLTDIVIDGYDLDPEFDPDVLEYTIDIPADEDSIDITAIPESEDSTVEIIGNENLKEGENIVLVKVTDKNGYVKYYQLNVNKAKKTILGLTPLQFWIIFGIILFLLLLLLLLLFLRRKKDDEEEVPPTAPSPVIEFKPEFNFGSKNGTDDDTIYSGGTLNQSSNNEIEHKEPRKIDYDDKDAKEVRFIEKEDVKEIPYDPYDDIVTKDELVDAIQEGLETKNPAKLKMLLEQEALNRKKEELRRQEEEDKD